mgnify:CR=1 FL=1
MESLIDDSLEGDKFLDGKRAKGNQIYRYPNGRIDYGLI